MKTDTNGDRLGQSNGSSTTFPEQQNGQSNLPSSTSFFFENTLQQVFKKNKMIKPSLLTSTIMISI
jgi:hypothetical protein